MIDRILLGHNQFFGVNHLMAHAGGQKEAFFSDISRIMDIIHFSFENGVQAMMMSTHERATLVSEAIEREQKLRQNLGIYLLMPYAAKYVRQANEKGLVNIIKDALSGTTFQDKVGLFWRGGVGLLTKDVERMLTAMIDFEVAPFTRLNLRAIFLHDVFTDLALGWDMPSVFELFAAHIKEKYNATPAFCSKNLPSLVRLLERAGIENPLIMASINKLGFQVNPSREAFEDCLRHHRLQLLAMSTLAAGYLKPKEAYEYLFSLPNIESVVVGVSNKEHALETFNTIRDYMTQGRQSIAIKSLTEALT